MATSVLSNQTIIIICFLHDVEKMYEVSLKSETMRVPPPVYKSLNGYRECLLIYKSHDTAAMMSHLECSNSVVFRHYLEKHFKTFDYGGGGGEFTSDGFYA